MLLYIIDNKQKDRNGKRLQTGYFALMCNRLRDYELKVQLIVL